MDPSYFEMTLMGRVGGAVSEHSAKLYGLRLAEFISSQFLRTKSVAGGAHGAKALAESVDLWKTLLIDGVQHACHAGGAPVLKILHGPIDVEGAVVQ